MFCKKCFCKINQVRNNPVVGIRPERCKLKAVAGLSFFPVPGSCFLYSIAPGTVGVIFSIRAVGDDKNLHVFEQPATSPERIPLVAFNLIECLTDGNTPALQFHMHQRQSIDKNGHIVAVVVSCAFRLPNNILIDDLQSVVVYIFMIDKRDVLGHGIITL